MSILYQRPHEGAGPEEVADDNPLPVRLGRPAITQGLLVDRSGSIASGAASQTLMGSNPMRRYLFVQNQAAEAMWIDFGGQAAVADKPAIQLPANGGSFVMEGSFVDTRAITVIAATTGSKFTAKEGQ